MSHTHEYRPGRGNVDVCNCGRFRFNEKAGPAIVGVPVVHKRLDLKRTPTGWAVYLPEEYKLFGTAWLPLPFTENASEEYVKAHCPLFQAHQAAA